MKLTNRPLLATVIAGILGLAPVAAAQPADIDWRQAEGTTLLVGSPTHIYSTALMEVIPEFEALTGIHVILDVHSQDAYQNKRLIDLSSGGGLYDVVMVDQAIVQYARAGWIEDLEPYFENPAFVDAETHDFDGYIPSILNEAIVDGKVYGLPVTATVQMLHYRKDIFEERGLEVPGTFDELYETAVALNEPGVMAGIIMRGQKIHTAWGSTSFVWSYGGRIFDDPVEPTQAMFGSAEAAEGIEMYSRLLRDAGPLGVGNYTWYEGVADFQQGKAAMYIEASTFMAQLEDPDVSTVSGNVGYAPFPSGPAGTYSNSLAWMLSISSSSKNKDAAFLFLTWATSDEMAQRIGEITGTSARSSFFESDYAAENFPADWAETFAAAAQVSNPEPGFPRIVEIDEWMDIYGGAVNATILGQGDAHSNLSRAAEQMNSLLR